ncbi:MAG: hypothetical protein AAF546_01885 [Verrucomicrobiota bacterium]
MFYHLGSFILFLLIGFSLTPFNVVFSQSSENVSVKLTAITLSGGIKDLKYESKGKIESLNVFNSVRSAPFDYVGRPEVVFFRELAPLSEESEPRRQVVGKVQIPTMTGEYLVIFSKLPGSSEQYRIAVLPDSLAVFKPGMYRFINLSPHDIRIQIGTEQTIIPQYGHRDLESRGEESKYQNTLIVSLPDKTKFEGAKPYRIYKGSLFFSSNLRTIYIMSSIPGGRPGRVKFDTIVERIPNS